MNLLMFWFQCQKICFEVLSFALWLSLFYLSYASTQCWLDIPSVCHIYSGFIWFLLPVEPLKHSSMLPIGVRGNIRIVTLPMASHDVQWCSTKHLPKPVRSKEMTSSHHCLLYFFVFHWAFKAVASCFCHSLKEADKLWNTKTNKNALDWSLSRWMCEIYRMESGVQQPGWLNFDFENNKKQSIKVVEDLGWLLIWSLKKLSRN